MKYRMPLFTRAYLKMEQLLWLPQELFHVRTKLLGHVHTFQNRLNKFYEIGDVVEKSLGFIENNKIGPVGQYSYKLGGPPLLYASAYAALTLHLTGYVKRMSPENRNLWVDYLNSYQDLDGIYRDPLIESQLAEEVDWWGWRHLSIHAASAVLLLGGKPRLPFRFLEFLNEPNAVQSWLENQDWTDAADVSNHVQNIGVMLQINRDYFGANWCSNALNSIYAWLDKHQDPETGLWGMALDTPDGLSNGVQAGYHFWLLYYYDHRPIYYKEKIIDSCLRTQNSLGGFGVPLNSSACEDIDSIDPLVRLQIVCTHRRDEIQQALKLSIPWILSNQNPDGGWTFRRYQAFRYGHSLMRTGPQESSMFATWFRVLSLAYIQKSLPINLNTKFVLEHIPGYQFWGD